MTRRTLLSWRHGHGRAKADQPGIVRGVDYGQRLTVDEMANAATDQDDAGDDAELLAKQSKGNSLLPYIEQDS